ncbi:Putative DNA-binding domain-containing protein [Cyclobacterium xiamenense]|uniref:Putative DNA-binding domain-containing protein n=1 Tax=Cyclobacterium xiamenense TaxID=1297121 RepID=A0A1H6WDY1_9BACT|nr:ATP-binding protein [Cyclobacterium xiamenense]SEJ13444.1 Putative DNA-binding domain-containing protein [Cyclobacterium xiamenense]
MTLRDIGKIAQKGEGLHVEFKKKAAHPEKIVKEIVALANTEGGHLLIGVDDDGTLSGQRYIEEEVYAMDKAIAELISPAIPLRKHVISLGPKKGLAVYEIKKSKAAPHFIWENKRKKAYVRVADKSIQASREMWEIMKRKQRQEDIVFKYGKKEELLMKALASRPHITLKEYMELAKIPIYIASRTLVKLVLANVIEVVPRESEDRFVPKYPFH